MSRDIISETKHRLNEFNTIKNDLSNSLIQYFKIKIREINVHMFFKNDFYRNPRFF